MKPGWIALIILACVLVLVVVAFIVVTVLVTSAVPNGGCYREYDDGARLCIRARKETCQDGGLYFQAYDDCLAHKRAQSGG